MLNIFQLPVKNSVLEDWAKLCLDVAKVAIVAMPVVLYGENSPLMKTINIIGLIIITYGLLALARDFRERVEEK